MKKNNHLRGELFKVLTTFSKSEMKKFGEFLESPYFNKSSKLIKVFRFIKKYYPSFQNRNLTLENIHLSLSPHTKYHIPTVRNELSDLYKLSLRFLGVQNHLSNIHNLLMDIPREFNQRNLFNLFDRFVNHTYPVLNGREGWNNELLLTRYNVNIQKVNKEYSLNNYRGERQNSNKIWGQYDEIFDDFHAFYLCSLADMYYNLKIANVDLCVDISERKLTKYLKSGVVKHSRSMLNEYHCKNPLLLLALNFFDMYNEFENTARYFEYKNNFLKKYHLLHRNCISMHFNVLTSYCLLKRREFKFRKQFTEEMLSLYDLILEKGFYKCSDFKYIQPMEFRNMIVISLENGNVNWALKLINEHTNKVEKQNREEVKNLGLMYLNFFSGNYDESIKYADMVIHPKFRTFKFDIMNTKLKIYYERRDFDPALNLLRSYKSTVYKTDMIPESNKERYKTFLNILFSLIKFRTDSKSLCQTSLENLEEEMKKAACSDWLLQKLNEIKRFRN